MVDVLPDDDMQDLLHQARRVGSEEEGVRAHSRLSSGDRRSASPSSFSHGRTPTPPVPPNPINPAYEMMHRRGERERAESVASYGSRGFSEAGVEDRRHRSASASAAAGHVLTEDTDSFIVGQPVYVDGVKPGMIQYIGETKFGPGDWAGVVLDERMGKNDGSVAGVRYFQCEPGHGVFARLFRLTTEPVEGASGAMDQMRRYGYELATEYCPVHPPGRKSSVGRRSAGSRSLSPSRSMTPEPRISRASPDSWKVGPQENLTVPTRRGETGRGGSPLGRRSPFASPRMQPRARITGGNVRIEKDPEMTTLTQEARRLTMTDQTSSGGGGKRSSAASAVSQSSSSSSYRRTSQGWSEGGRGYYGSGRKSSSSTSRGYYTGGGASSSSRRTSDITSSSSSSRYYQPHGVSRRQSADSQAAERRRRSEAGMRRRVSGGAPKDAVLNADPDALQVGQKVWVDGDKPGRIAYIGGVRFARGEVAGVHLEEPVGKNNGTVGGVMYFYCHPNHGVFARLHRLALEPMV